jgi:hypothetical protein
MNAEDSWCGLSIGLGVDELEVSTAIISAYGAHLLAQDWSASNAMAHIAAGQAHRTDKLFGPGPDIPDLLANVVWVQQRFGV